MTKKTFRGLLVDGGQDKIHLAGDKPEDGYRMTKFQIMSETPYDQNAAEHIVKVYKKKQTSVDGVVDFSSSILLGVAIINNNTTGYSYPSLPTIIFDQETVNQDIFVTHSDVVNAVKCNYYIELEQVKMGGPEQAAVNFRAALTHDD